MQRCVSAKVNCPTVAVQYALPVGWSWIKPLDWNPNLFDREQTWLDHECVQGQQAGETEQTPLDQLAPRNLGIDLFHKPCNARQT